MTDIPANNTTTATFTDFSEIQEIATFSGVLETDSDRDWVRIELSAGTYSVFLHAQNSGSGATGDGELTIRDAGGVIVASDTDTGQDLNALVTFTVVTGGDFFIEADLFAALTANYTITITTLSALSFVQLGFAPDVTVADANIMGEQGDDTLTGGVSDNILTGGTGDDTLDGADGNDVLFGDAGDDLLVGGIGNDDLLGGDGDDFLFGGNDNDLMRGGAGNDFIQGGNGNDIILGGDGDDVMSSGAGVDTFFLELKGNDTITAFDIAVGADRLDVREFANIGTLATWQFLSTNVASGAQTTIFKNGVAHTLTITGFAVATFVADNFIFSAFADSQTIFGTDNADDLIGAAGNDVLVGGLGNDRLFGEQDDDFLNGGGGNDTLVGGAGNDTYVVDTQADTVIETAGNGTADKLIASVNYTLGAAAHVEIMETSAPAGTTPLTLVGNALLGQSITGNAGANFLGGGNDAFVDTLIGGAGNDNYGLAGSANDVITDTGGIDTIQSSITRSLVGFATIDNLTLFGAGVIDGTGNALANIIIGNTQVNTLDGLGGADSLIGGAGNDIYIIDSAFDNITENVATGDTGDRARTSVTFALAKDDAIDVLETTNAAGVGGINLTGNEFGQTLIGNAGANVINGGLANDTLTGGAGNDFFEFNTALGATNVDSITDFNVAADTLRVKASGGPFGQPTLGTLGAAFFKANASGTATDADDRFVYNTATGAISFDADGNGAIAAIQFATLTQAIKPVLTAADFFVI